jgi:lipoprotein-anchoring transpeptidase ErfK/SrfK
MKALLAALAFSLTAAFAAPSMAAVGGDSTYVRATVSISQQQMEVVILDAKTGLEETLVWTVSTGATGYTTPTGNYQPTWLSRHHRSRQYDNAPMPWAVFFHNGYAVHATFDLANLGRPASHGCVRLAPEDAAVFFELVRTVSMDNTEIVIVD